MFFHKTRQIIKESADRLEGTFEVQSDELKSVASDVISVITKITKWVIFTFIVIVVNLIILTIAILA